MSEPTPEVTPAAPEAPAVTPPATQNENDLPQWAREAISKANREAANYRTQVAELKPQADQFRMLEEASKSEAQRLAEAAEAARRDADTFRSEAIRYKAAATFGIPAEHFDLLGTGTEDEISARAEKIRALLATPPAAPAAPASTAPQTRPVAQLRPGATPGEPQNEDDVLYQQLFGS
jgi:hypothetical protein